jgi:putative acetyltransferase
MSLTIRPITREDATAINAIRRHPAVYATTLGIASERVSGSQAFIDNLSKKDHLFVAEVDGTVVGVAGLHEYPSPRMRHKGHLGIMIDPAHQGQGIGRKLMETLLDLADNWLMLDRLELEVFSDHAKAIRLYESLGFVVEGTRRASLIQNGKLVDETIMGRIRSESR